MLSNVNAKGLYWRIGMPVVLLMLAATIAIVVAMRAQLEAQARVQLEQLAEADAAFVRQGSLPGTENLAASLQRVTGFGVHFRRGDRLLPTAAKAGLAADLKAVPTDGIARDLRGGAQAVARPLADGTALVLVRESRAGFFDPRIVQVVLGTWLVALLLFVLVVRGLVVPLRNLAAQLPRIEQREPLAVPEAERSDEIGDVARALVAAQRGLHDERDRRLQAERLAVLGRMTASLAHQLQNPVAAIKMHAQLWGDGDGPAAVVESEAGRIERLLNQWMYLTRPEPPTLARADVGELLDQLVQAQAARLEHAAVEVDLRCDGALDLPCDRDRLLQVFDNLIGNAVQAMPEGGTLRIDARGGSDAIDVAFEDAGPGFSAQALQRAGEFFFSEKEGGMGIGLAVAREIAQAHGGALQIDNIATGARVTLHLPRSVAGRTES